MRKFFIAVPVLALCAQLSAQNINQSVQVTNDYVTRFADFQKQGDGLRVPDSLYRFDYSFDYSVFDTPYKGAYEFSPYRIQVTPEPRPYDGGTLWLRAGAGYSLHPSFELAWAALRRGNARVDVFADAGGYVGKYRRMRTSDPFAGHDIHGRAGVGGEYLLPSVRLTWQAGYEGIAAREDVETPYFSSGFNSGTAGVRAQSRPGRGSMLFYDVNLRYRYAAENYAAALSRGGLGENNVRVGVSVGPELEGKYRILLDAAFEMDALRERAATSGKSRLFPASHAALRPHVDFSLGPVQLDAGVRLDYGEWSADKKFTVAPDVTARLDLLEQDLTVFAGVSGGQSMQGFYQTKHVNHFAFRTEPGASLSREKIRVRAGLDGHWNSRLQYGFEAGYVSHAGLPLSSYCAVYLVDFSSVYARARAAWNDERVSVDGTLGYDYLMMPEFPGAYAPPAFTADLRGSYNWQRRIFAGAFLEAASVRKALWPDEEGVGGYVNLGLTGEFRIDRRWGVWAEAGNLLGMRIERLPGYIEQGPYLTLGLSLKL